ncbi:YbaK / prolyl-tRNA synthetases associated domain protein [Phycisphaerae bacterium RAS2]|nr:YbaK / prolyl-tRNA synthetases associated domain protein [Phycisphaerae bacterium RAS2]
MQLEKLLRKEKIPFEKKTHRTAFTSQELAAAEHIPGRFVAKPVLVKGDKGFAMCVIAACDRLDLARAAQALGEPRVELATEQEMRIVCPDCEIGAEPPIGRLFNLKTVMDERLSNDTYLVMQAGTHTEAVKLLREDWERVCNPIKARIAV